MTQGLPALVDEFCRRPELAPKTRTFYGEELRRHFLPWAAAHGVEAAEDVTPEAVNTYAIHLDERTTRAGLPLRPATRRAYLKALQQFMGWLVKRKGVQGIDPGQVPLPSLRRQQREVLTQDEIRRMEAAAPTERNKLLVRLAADTGARLGEIAALRRDDVVERSRTHYIRLRGKTGERLTPISPALYRRLVTYGHGGRPKSSNARLFMADRRRPGGDYEPLTTAGIYRVFKDAAERAGIERRIWPHLFRHSAITQLVVQGTHPAMVSQLLGVSVQVVASHYSHPTLEQSHAAMMRALTAREEEE